MIAPRDLERIAEDAASRPRLWAHLVRHEARRTYAELDLGLEDANAWVIAWMNGHTTGFHDHGGSSGGVAVCSGEVREDRFTLDDPYQIVHGRYCRGRTFGFGPRVVHCVRHESQWPAVTVHVYSPPLVRMTSFDFDERGRIVLTPRGAHEELRPLERLTLLPDTVEA